MYKVCEKCGFMYDDTSSGCPQCGTNHSPANQENIGSNSNGNVNTQGFGSFSTNSTEKSSQRSSGGLDVKKLLIIATAVLIPVVLVVVCLIFFPGFTTNRNNTVVDSDFDSNVSVDDNENDFEDSGVNYMPSCIGWPMDKVKDYFRSKDCEIKFEYVYNSDVAANCVIKQTIEPGSELTPGCTIIFEMSNGEGDSPVEYQQKIVVTGSKNSSNATLKLMIWENGAWETQYTCFATVGKNGLGDDYGEGKGVTPIGVFKLGVVLSESSIYNSTWPNRIVSEDTCIVDDSASTYYNTIRNISDLPSDVHYDDIGNTIINGNSDKVMYIEHNGNGIDSEGVVPGKGSAITICGKTSDLYATAGCIDISAGDFNSILSLLDYSMNPHIEITV